MITDKMKSEYLSQILNWQYDGDYSVYNLPPLKVMRDKNYDIVN